MNLLRSLTSRSSGQTLSVSDVAALLSYQGVNYFPAPITTLGGTAEEIGSDFTGLASGAYRSSGPIFACIATRMALFSEARFQFQRLRSGRPGDLYGTEALRPLEQPWPGGTTGNMLARAELDVSLAGNWFGARIGGGIRRMRPDWVTILLGSDMEPDDPGIAADAQVVGYIYHPGGRGGRGRAATFLPSEVAHYAPKPDPIAGYRGMSWLTPIIREIMADRQMTEHQISFLEKGATPNLVVSLSESNPEKFAQWVEKFNADHAGAANAYRTLFLGSGADVKSVGTNLEQLDFKVVRGAGETRIAAAAEVPPVIVGFSEGLSAATYSNYAQARRRFADGTLRPMWREMAGSLAPIIDVPADSRLWYDDRDVPFLQEDVKDEAEIQETHARTIRTLVDGGYTPESAVAAVLNGDMSMLVHTGLFSVQLQPPGAQSEPASPDNGEGPPERARRALASLAETIER